MTNTTQEMTVSAEYTQSTNDDDRTVEGEYIHRGEIYDDDPTQVFDELVARAARYMADNPKKTAVIVTATTAAAVVAAITAATTVAVFMVAGELRKRWRSD